MPRKKVNKIDNTQETVKVAEKVIIEAKPQDLNIQTKSNKKIPKKSVKNSDIEVISNNEFVSTDEMINSVDLSANSLENVDTNQIQIIDLSVKSTKKRNKKKKEISTNSEIVDSISEISSQEISNPIDEKIDLENVEIIDFSVKSTKKKNKKKVKVDNKIDVDTLIENANIVDLSTDTTEKQIFESLDNQVQIVEAKPILIEQETATSVDDKGTEFVNTEIVVPTSETVAKVVKKKKSKNKKKVATVQIAEIANDIIAEKADDSKQVTETVEVESIIQPLANEISTPIADPISQKKSNRKSKKNKQKAATIEPVKVVETPIIKVETPEKADDIVDETISDIDESAKVELLAIQNRDKAALIAERKRAKRIRRKERKNQKFKNDLNQESKNDSVMEIIPKNDTSIIEVIENPVFVDSESEESTVIVVDLNKELYQPIHLNKVEPIAQNTEKLPVLSEIKAKEVIIDFQITNDNLKVSEAEKVIPTKSANKNKKKNKNKNKDKEVKETVVEQIASVNLEAPKESLVINKIEDALRDKNLDVPEINVEIPAKFVSKLEKEIIPVHIADGKDLKTVKILEKKEQKHNQLIKVNEKKQLEKRKTSLKRLIPDYSIIPQQKLLTNAEKSNPLIMNAINKVDEFMRKELYIESGMKFILAVSGGVDSIVLLDIMAQLASKYYFSIYVGHFNHNLRGENSKKDEQFVKSLAEQYKLNYYHSSGNVKQFSEKNSISIEHSARTLRYNFYERTARTITADFVASAHNADDSAETFLINLMRGSGLTGLSGIPSKRHLVKNVLIVRPLINFKKAEIIEYAKMRNLKWREDESNSLMNYTRNKVRLDLLPKLRNDYNPSIVDTLNRTARLIQSADSIVNDIVKKNLVNLVSDISTERFMVKISILQTFDDFIQGELIQASMQKYFRSHPLNLNTIDRILSLINSITGSVAEINNNYLVLRDRDYLIFSKKSNEVDIEMRIAKTGEFKIGKFKLILKEVKKVDVKFNPDPRIEYLDGDLLPNNLEIRNWMQGDSFQPLGMGTQKVSDFLTNIKMPLIDKPKVLVLKTKTEIIWLVGLRLSEKFKVTAETKSFISAEIKVLN